MSLPKRNRNAKIAELKAKGYPLRHIAKIHNLHWTTVAEILRHVEAKKEGSEKVIV